MIDLDIAVMLDNITKAATAIGVIIAVISSFGNKKKLNEMDKRIIDAAVEAGMAAERASAAAENAQIAARNTDVIVAKANEVKAQIAEVREAALAVNAEVIDKLKNGTSNGGNRSK